VPGDWGFIRNKAFERDPVAWGSGIWVGENVIHLGTTGYLASEGFWGHLYIEDVQCEECWFDDIRYRWYHGLGGDPEWIGTIFGPGIGLEPNIVRRQ